MDRIFDLSNFDSYRENNCLEVKKAKGGLPNSLWDSYSSMCNTYGGAIILGVIEHEDHSWETCGLKDASKLKKDFWDTINNCKKVSINLLKEEDVEDYIVNDDVILVIYVPRAAREIRPVYINDNLMGGTFKRNWEGDYHCTPREIKAMLRDQADESPDMKVIDDMTITDFDQESVKSYRMQYLAKHPDSAWSKLSDEDFLIRIGAASEDLKDKKVIHPTGAGLLMFGQEYLITREYPEYFLDFREKLDPSIRWTDRVQTQSGDFSGNIFDFFNKVYKKLTADFKVPFMLEGAFRIEETPKHKAVREALANALVNTDYFQGWSVVIEHYHDKIVLANPGTIIPGKKQMLRGGISEPRNKILFKMFNLIGVGDHAGSGVPDIYDVWNTEGLLEPIVEEQFGTDVPDRTTLILPLVKQIQDVSEKGPEKGPKKGPDRITEVNTKSKADEIEQRRIAIFHLIKENPNYSRTRISKETEASERQTRDTLEFLKENGYIHHEGTAKGGKWIIDKEYP